MRQRGPLSDVHEVEPRPPVNAQQALHNVAPNLTTQHSPQPFVVQQGTAQRSVRTSKQLPPSCSTSQPGWPGERQAASACATSCCSALPCLRSSGMLGPRR